VIGKFRLSLKKVRTKRAKAKIVFCLKSFVRRWVSRRRIISKTKIIKFLQHTVEQPYIFGIMTQVYKRVTVLQRTVKLFLKRRKLTYAFNCRNWVEHEVDILN
jgi:hypothetical protein